MDAVEHVITLWRPVGAAELKLIEDSGMRAFPPRLAHQPIFYPAPSEEYAVKIARDWNVAAEGAGFVTSFRMRTAMRRRKREGVRISNLGVRRRTWAASTLRLPARSRS
jgi:hypothetical protein